MAEKPKYTRYLALSSVSSLAYLVLIVLMWRFDGEDLVAGLGNVAALLLFGAFVLVPHVPTDTRTPFRILVLVCLPLLFVWVAAGLVEAIGLGLDKVIDHYIADTVWLWIYAATGGAWVLVLANAVVWISKVTRSRRFWGHVLLVAAACVTLIIVGGSAFLECFLSSCPKWMNMAIFVSFAILLMGMPVALTSALYFGIEDRTNSSRQTKY